MYSLYINEWVYYQSESMTNTDLKNRMVDHPRRLSETYCKPPVWVCYTWGSLNYEFHPNIYSFILHTNKGCRNKLNIVSSPKKTTNMSPNVRFHYYYTTILMKIHVDLTVERLRTPVNHLWQFVSICELAHRTNGIINNNTFKPESLRRETWAKGHRGLFQQRTKDNSGKVSSVNWEL